MEKFAEYEYVRPDLEKIRHEFLGYLQEFKEADTYEQQDEAMKKIYQVRNYADTMANLVYIRHSIDTADDYYKNEQDFIDELDPHLKGLADQFYQELVQSAFRSRLEEKWGKQLFQLAECQLKTFSEEVLEDLQKENKLSSEYTKLVASAKIEFDGGEYTLAQLQPFMESTDRDVRKRANEAKFQFFAYHGEEFDRIYDQLVKLRDQIAKKLGFANFIELGYARMNRLDYNASMAAAFRDQVKEYIVPAASRLYEKQKKRIRTEELAYYDEPVEFLTGNAVPKGDAEWIVNNGQKMYSELSGETDEFFKFMNERNLLDLLAKKGKAAGGYCTYIADHHAPYIFANFNGTADDLMVLTHEVGHAFQVYMSRGYEVSEYHFPTYEACEIHSMSMEFFTWPWMDLFFKEDTDKYKFSHLAGALLFIPYGVAVDEFQHYVYGNPEASPEERHQAWREIEHKYLPDRNYAGNEYLEKGGFWQKQSHIYSSPFYYIDYTLAQICALQFWKRLQDEDQNAWEDYLNLCRQGGSKSFLELVKEANLESPFKKGALEKTVAEAENWLNSIDDLAL
ncbi:M3 family oligoendopeptidase [Metabacillus sp. GX 13764]|uniref:M3 family oligoendopeptidase n=1 Tax=Metabacillus kandeliae TaxID=2900151 RepID=UPI001E556EE4|nr:M3 family oligoendopeptidase [Metabacillus kandeliae]MCD7036152.1 M3 family oligoendopeptidase [Metabacillus kandeliae]